MSNSASDGPLARPDDAEGAVAASPRFEVFAWVLLDWAASAFSTISITLLVAYIEKVVFAGEPWGVPGGVVWAWTLAVAMLVLMRVKHYCFTRAGQPAFPGHAPASEFAAEAARPPGLPWTTGPVKSDALSASVFAVTSVVRSSGSWPVDATASWPSLVRDLTGISWRPAKPWKRSDGGPLQTRHPPTDGVVPEAFAPRSIRTGPALRGRRESV